MKKALLVSTAGALVLAAGAAAAQTSSGPDVSAVVTDIGYAAVAGGTIGVAYLGMVAGIRLYKWVRAAM